MVKRKLTRTKLEIFCLNTFLPVYNFAQKRGGLVPLPGSAFDVPLLSYSYSKYGRY